MICCRNRAARSPRSTTRSTARQAPPKLYDAKDDWDTYDSIAPALTKAYYAFAEGGHQSARAGQTLVAEVAIVMRESRHAANYT